MANKTRAIHESSDQGFAHPFKFLTLCGKAVRFGGSKTDDRPVTCKNCLKIMSKKK